jgi:hypothetical protein
MQEYDLDNISPGDRGRLAFNNDIPDMIAKLNLKSKDLEELLFKIKSNIALSWVDSGA